MATKKMVWHECVDAIEEFVVKIQTPGGWGTGFLLCRSKKSGLVGIATAKHVVEHAQIWNQPIRLQHYDSSESVLFDAASRAIFLNDKRDVATVIVKDSDLKFPTTIPEFGTKDHKKKDGVELGWLGFPVVSPGNLCFFSGRTSTYLWSDRAYLIDGVAINGVSGGPVFDEYADIVGLVTAYLPNVATGQTLPGLCLAYDVDPLRPMIERFRNMDEAKEVEQSQTSDAAIASGSSSGEPKEAGEAPAPEGSGEPKE